MDDLTIPAFLDRKVNGIVTEKVTGLKRADRNGIVWPKKRNWRKLEKRRRAAEKEIWKGYVFRARPGQ